MVYPEYKLPFEELTTIDERVDYIRNQLVAAQLALNQLLEKESMPPMTVVTRDVNLRVLLQPNTGTRVSRPSPLTGRIVQLIPHFPDGCLSGDSLIITASGQARPISSLQHGENVLCHNSSGKVLGVSEREYTGPTYRLKPLGCLDFLITPEHPVLAIKRSEVLCPVPTRVRGNIVCQPWKCPTSGCTRKKQWNLDWIPAGELEKGDIVAIKVPKEVNTLEYLPIQDLGISNYADNRHKKIPERIPVTKEFLKLLGYYLAEGCIHKHGESGHNREVQFTVGGHEGALAEDIRRCARSVFDVECNSRIRGNRIDVVLGGIVFTELFKKLCGEYAKQKRIHALLMSLPPEKQMHIIEGFWAGDGYSVKARHQKVLTTANKELAHQLWMILLRNNINATICFIQHPIRQIEGRELKSATMYNVYWFEPERHCGRYHLNGHLLTPIVRIDRESFKGKVYNLTVPRHNSYVVNGIAVHNCNALVDVAVGHKDTWIYPHLVDTFVALNDATPVLTVDEPITKGEEIWMIVRNADGREQHAITVTATVIGVE